MTKCRLVILTALAALAVSACVSSTPSESSPPPTDRLTDVLLDEDALGGGWQESDPNEPRNAADLQVCGRNVVWSRGASAEALRLFKNGINVFGHGLATFEDEDESRERIDELKTAASECSEWTGDDGLTWNLERIDAVPQDDDVVAIRMTTEGGTETQEGKVRITTGYTAEYVVWRRGRVISTVGHAYAEASTEFVVEMYATADDRLQRSSIP